jgi:hypothetical protein
MTDDSARVRQRLPGRRLELTEALEWKNNRFLLSVGFDREGRAREVFVAGLKTGTDLEFLAQDACITTSYVLQYGVAARELAERLGGRLLAGEPLADNVSLLRIIVDRVAQLEDQNAEAVRQAYAWARGDRGVLLDDRA